MSEDDELINKIEEAMNRVLSERARIDSETHTEHHNWVANKMAKEAEGAKDKKTIIMWCFQWSVVGLLSLIAVNIVDIFLWLANVLSFTKRLK